MEFANREEAGRVLARKLMRYAGWPDLIVLAVPRGGLPVGEQVALALGAPLDVFIVRKLGVPGHEELAMGALASGNVRVLNDDVVEHVGIDDATIARVVEQAQRELERRERAYRDGRPPMDPAGKVAILVDDGMATGASMRAAVEALRLRGPSQIVVAVPVAPADACYELGRVADDLVCAMMPEPFYGVGLWYRNFTQITDEQVRTILRRQHAAGAQPWAL